MPKKTSPKTTNKKEAPSKSQASTNNEIKFDEYNPFGFVSNYFLLIIIYLFIVLPLFNIGNAINIHNKYIEDYNNSLSINNAKIEVRKMIEIINSNASVEHYQPITITYNLTIKNRSIDFNDNKMILFNDNIYKEVRVGRRTIKSRLSKPILKSTYVDKQLLDIRFDSLPLSIPTHNYTTADVKSFMNEDVFIRIVFYNNEDVSTKSLKSNFYKSSTLKSLIQNSQPSFKDKSIRRIEVYTEDGKYYLETYYPSGLPAVIGIWDTNVKPSSPLEFALMYSLFDSRGKMHMRQQLRKQEYIFYSNIFIGKISPSLDFFNLTKNYNYRDYELRERGDDRKDFIINNHKNWMKKSQTEKIYNTINRIDAK